MVSLRALKIRRYYIHDNALILPVMTLKTEDVKEIAHLARLDINEQAVSQYVADLSSILDMVEEMNQVETDGVVPMAHPMDAKQRLRVDEVTETDRREKLQSISPDVENGLFRVPKVIE